MPPHLPHITLKKEIQNDLILVYMFTSGDHSPYCPKEGLLKVKGVATNNDTRIMDIDNHSTYIPV